MVEDEYVLLVKLYKLFSQQTAAFTGISKNASRSAILFDKTETSQIEPALQALREFIDVARQKAKELQSENQDCSSKIMALINQIPSPEIETLCWLLMQNNTAKIIPLKKATSTALVKMDEILTRIHDAHPPLIVRQSNSPFYVFFHRCNDKDTVQEFQRTITQLPKTVDGRKMEYSVETDFFWIEHESNRIDRKMSLFFGHAINGLIPWKKWMLYRMKDGPGLLRSEWLLSQLRGKPILIDIKAGWGNDARALNQLATLLKNYGMAGNVFFTGFSLWPLEYLKEQLPTATTLINFKGFGNHLFVFPFTTPWKTFTRFGLVQSLRNLPFVDGLSRWRFRNLGETTAEVQRTARQKKLCYIDHVNTKEQFFDALQAGAIGVGLSKDISPQMVESWLVE